jgi:hypothetical protein
MRREVVIAVFISLARQWADEIDCPLEWLGQDIWTLMTDPDPKRRALARCAGQLVAELSQLSGVSVEELTRNLPLEPV